MLISLQFYYSATEIDKIRWKFDQHFYQKLDYIKSWSLLF